MHISNMKQSNFLTRADVGTGVLMTIKAIHQENVAKEGAAPEMKWAMSFVEADKPMILNSTNLQLIALITKSEETDTWPGQKIVLYDDPSVSYAGKLVGGIRIRAPRGAAAKAAAAPKPKLAPEPEPEGAGDPETPF